MSLATQAVSCRCDLVHRWLDAHEKYFTKPPGSTTSLSETIFTPNHFKHYNTEVTLLSKDIARVQFPYLVPAPYLVSPMKPGHKPYRTNN